ncbi:MAG: hypothetical protein K2W97_06290 [Chthoniobacterales bacterium]|nr:hypothetical protein [Chthoniobacterales bacterium]
MKKINQIIRIILLAVSLFSSSLLAQQNLGASNKYPIGTDENPVLATEYCEYLNDKAPNDGAWVQSWYYDSSFMHADQDWMASPNAAIERTGWSRGYVIGSGYHYSVVPNHENDRIVAVYWQSVQTEFNVWRAAREAAAAAAAAEISNNNHPAPDNSDTPVTDNNDTTVIDNSDTPVASNSDTQAADNSDTPVASNSDTPATEELVTQN